jgi:hypothetical protein
MGSCRKRLRNPFPVHISAHGDHSMLLKTLREQVLKANLELVCCGRILYTFNNASGIDRREKLVAIKPSGVPYAEMPHVFNSC